MLITVSFNGEVTPLTFNSDFDEYVQLLAAALAPQGAPPLTAPETLKRILQDNYAAHIRNHPQLRPAKIAARMKEIEQTAAKAIEDSVAETVA